MPRPLLIASAALVLMMTACNNQSNPDEIRQRTAQATETVRRDTKAVVDGVREGMGHDGAVNINNASHEDLLGLPGVTDRDADRIIAGRPFDSADDLVKRRIISLGQYDRIRARIVAAR